jgi:hypothetical protein
MPEWPVTVQNTPLPVNVQNFPPPPSGGSEPQGNQVVAEGEIVVPAGSLARSVHTMNIPYPTEIPVGGRYRVFAGSPPHTDGLPEVFGGYSITGSGTHRGRTSRIFCSFGTVRIQWFS